VRFFVRSIVLAVVVSMAGLSSAVVICVTGCTDSAASARAANAQPPCHHPAEGGGQTIGAHQATCTHQPASIGAGVLSFDTRLSPGALPIAAGQWQTLLVGLLDTSTPLKVSAPFASQRPTALRI
jgi:hypothetical protein